MLTPGKYDVLVFKNRLGNQPYVDWLDSLDWKTQERILQRVGRLSRGQFGDFKSIDKGLYELRLFFGPGYRVYFGEYNGRRIIILAGGDKSTQKQDIRLAKESWQIYLEDHQ